MAQAYQSSAVVDPVLRCTGLSVGYNGNVVIRDVSFDANPAELLLIFGANGSGKSTLFKTLIGLLRPIQGRIFCKGREITGAPPSVTSKLGLAYVPQERRIFATLTVEDNLDLGGYLITGALARDAAKERALVTFPVLREKLHLEAHTLSGGEQQLLGFARALVPSPDVILLDEPSLGLDQSRLRDMRNLVSDEMSRGVAFVVIEQRADTFRPLEPSQIFRLDEGIMRRSD